MPHGPWAKNTIFQLTIQATALGQRIVNVHHFEATGVMEATLIGDVLKLTACQQLIDAWQAAAYTQWRACHNAQYVVNMLRCQVVEVRNQVSRKLVPIEEIQSSGNTGTDAATQVDDTASSAVIKWRSTVAGKSHRGRTYLGPLPQTWTQDGVLQSAGVTAANAYGTAMIGAYGASAGTDPNYRLTIYSRPYNHLEYGYATGKNPNRTWFYPPDYDGDSTNVVNHSVDPTLRTQRRRELGVGA